MSRFFGPSARWLVAATLLVLAPSAAFCQADFSVRYVPADVSFYGSLLRNREQFDIVMKSKAFEKFKNLPFVQEMWQNVDQGLAFAMGQLKQDPENEALLDLLAEAVSDEVFVTGGDAAADFLALYGQVNNSTRFSGMMQAFQPGRQAGPAGPGVPDMVRALAKSEKLIRIPDLLVGFKLKNPAAANKQIKRLEDLLGNFGPFAKMVKIRDNDFLTISGAGNMVPWGDFIKPLEEKEGEFDAVIKKLGALKLTISIGVSNGYLLFGIDESTRVVENFAGAGRRLADLPEFNRLAKYAAEKLTSVGYASKAYRSRSDGDDGLSMFRGIIETVPKEVVNDAAKKKLLGMMKIGKTDPSAIGADLSLSYLTADGYEGVNFDWTKHNQKDSARPLSLAQHLGGAPILAAVGRTEYNPADYQEMIAGIVELKGVADLVAKDWDKEKKAKYDKSMKAYAPLFQRLDQLTGQSLLPSLAEGQVAVVLDAKWASARWHKEMPISPRTLPMLELGFVFGVKDADLLEKTMPLYAKWVEDMIAETAKVYPDLNIKAMTFPKAEMQSNGETKLFTWSLPEELGLDRQIAPSTGLTKKVAVAAASIGHAERLLKPTPINSELRLLKDHATQPLSGLSLVDFTRLIDAISPWVEYGIRESHKNAGGDDPEPIITQARDFMTILQCFRGIGSITNDDNDVRVTRSQSLFRDLK